MTRDVDVMKEIIIMTRNVYGMYVSNKQKRNIDIMSHDY